MIQLVLIFGSLALFGIISLLQISNQPLPKSQIDWYNADNIEKQLSKCDSYIEERLYKALLEKGYKPITQYKCDYYWIDIALPEYRLAIECDGKQWHSSPEQKRHDARKNYYLKKKGWKVCRLSGKTINSNLGVALNHIEKRAYIG